MLGVARPLLELNSNIQIIVESISATFIQFLEILGISTQRIIELNEKSKPILVMKLYTTYFNECGFQSAENTRSMRKWIRERNADLYFYDSKPNDIVLISNGAAECSDCLSNAEMLIQTLKINFSDRRIVEVSFQELSVLEQMRIVANARILISPFGDSLASAIFLKDNCGLIEIHNNEKFMSTVYMELALNLDLIYRGVSPLVKSRDTFDYKQADIQLIVKAIVEILSVQDTYLMHLHPITLTPTLKPTMEPTVPPTVARTFAPLSASIFQTNNLDGTIVVHQIRPELPKEKKEKCLSFRLTRDIYIDDECFPPVVSIYPVIERRIDSLSRIKRVSLESFKTQNFISKWDYKFDDKRNEPAKLKSFRDSIVWRDGHSTYFKGVDGWSICSRCTIIPENEKSPSNSTPKRIIDEAFLTSSQIWVN